MATITCRGLDHETYGNIMEYRDFHSHGGSPIAGWFTLWKIHQWMMTEGTPILGNLHITIDKPWQIAHIIVQSPKK
jgi:hypothetical protein